MKKTKYNQKTTLLVICAAIFMSFAFIPVVQARVGHIAALSVAENNESIGGVADLSLEIRPGTGAVYIQTIPLTQLDTQVSARIANEIACQRATVDCSDYDFFYVINVKSSLIGGPSAGGALAVLTYAVLEDLPIRNDTAMTGAILSGGIIGPVGGVSGKVAAAKRAGYSAVVIPAWDYNETSDLSQENDISIYRVRNLDEAIEQFTGEKPKVLPRIDPPKAYVTGMKLIADSLCERAKVLGSELDENKLAQALNQTNEQLGRGETAENNGEFYSAASLCFSASLSARSEILTEADENSRAIVLTQTEDEVQKLRDALNRTTVTNLADLEIAMIVDERVTEVENVLGKIDQDSLLNNTVVVVGPTISKNNTNITNSTNETTAINASEQAAQELAYAAERLETASAWFTLSGTMPGEKITATPALIEQSCRAKFDEANELANYVSYVYPEYTTQLQDSLQLAYSAIKENKYLLCILQASEAKAQANTLLTAIYVPQSEYSTIINEKLDAADSQLAKASSEGVFPILGFSYAEYARELFDTDPYSASLYSEYSLELSRLDLYFPNEHKQFMPDLQNIEIFSIGILLGIALGICITLFGGKIWQRKQHNKIVNERSRKNQKSYRPKNAPLARSVPGKKR